MHIDIGSAQVAKSRKREKGKGKLLTFLLRNAEGGERVVFVKPVHIKKAFVDCEKSLVKQTFDHIF